MLGGENGRKRTEHPRLIRKSKEVGGKRIVFHKIYKKEREGNVQKREAIIEEGGNKKGI